MKKMNLVILATLLVSNFSTTVLAQEGGVSTGGGNIIAGKVVESYRVDMTSGKLSIAADVQKALTKIYDKTPNFASRISMTLRKKWYFVPVKLSELSRKVTGLPISTDQGALHTKDTVWVDKNLFDSMMKQEQVKLIMHELIMGEIFFRFEGRKTSAELHELVRDLTDVFVSEIDQWSAISLSDLLKQKEYYTSSKDFDLNENGDDVNLDNPLNDPNKVDAAPLFQKLDAAFRNGQTARIEEAFPECQFNETHMLDNKLRILAKTVSATDKYYSFLTAPMMPCHLIFQIGAKTTKGVGNLFPGTSTQGSEQFLLMSQHENFWKNDVLNKLNKKDFRKMEEKANFYKFSDYFERNGGCTGECEVYGDRNTFTTVKSVNQNGEQTITERVEDGCRDASGIFPWVSQVVVRKNTGEFIIRYTDTDCSQRGKIKTHYGYSGYWK